MIYLIGFQLLAVAIAFATLVIAMKKRAAQTILSNSRDSDAVARDFEKAVAFLNAYRHGYMSGIRRKVAYPAWVREALTNAGHQEMLEEAAESGLLVVPGRVREESPSSTEEY